MPERKDGRPVLHVCLHDVTPRHGETVREIHDRLREIGVDRYGMLVVPDFHGRWPLDDHPEFCAWLRNLREDGVSMLLHGFTHRSSGGKLNPFDRVRAMCFTRGEGEFLGLDADEALVRIGKGLQLLEDVLGTRIHGFAAPAWLYSRGTMEALRTAGFEYAENRFRAWNPSTGNTLLRCPVVNYSGGSTMKRALAGYWVILSRLVLSGSAVVRFAVHPDDLLDRSRWNGVVRQLRRLLETRVAKVPW